MRRVAAIGMFDGVHLGHRHLLRRLAEEAELRSAEPLVVTFANHPLSLVCPERAPRLLSAPVEKEALLRDAGVVPLTLDFDDNIRATSTAEFMRRLSREQGVDAILLGFNNHFGHDRPATFAAYEEIGRCEGVEIVRGDELTRAGSAVSSSEIRRLLGDGALERANDLLGRHYEISGTVVKGHQVGRTIGFPTANIAADFAEKLIPANGVYAVDVTFDGGGERRIAVMNIGVRPTLSGAGRTIEVFIPGLDADLYGARITVGLLRRLRDERKFDSLDALKAQIALDLRQALDTIC